MAFFKREEGSFYSKSRGSAFNVSDGSDSSGDSRISRSKFRSSMSASHKRFMSESVLNGFNSSQKVVTSREEEVVVETVFWGPQRFADVEKPCDMLFSVQEEAPTYVLTHLSSVETHALNPYDSPRFKADETDGVFDDVHPVFPTHYKDFLKAREIVREISKRENYCIKNYDNRTRSESSSDY
ncbi:unnamed protein product [Bursaphelenchus okinawaensis]|uniref:Uncharacterized protein n=1 Tax=Bursaphelenchus okinawaensis TaxID=465554 RepID=A0A811JSH2_9BILA|nr:unnamed protein product [Bursaphelenchus okinawaensis]CAG9081160.1 unnamed protein product [Bursaphelenchus okinawaensis]